MGTRGGSPLPAAALRAPAEPPLDLARARTGPPRPPWMLDVCCAESHGEPLPLPPTYVVVCCWSDGAVDRGISAGPNSASTELAPANDRRTEMKSPSQDDARKGRRPSHARRRGARAATQLLLLLLLLANAAGRDRNATQRWLARPPMEAGATPFKASFSQRQARIPQRASASPRCSGRRCGPGSRRRGRGSAMAAYRRTWHVVGLHATGLGRLSPFFPLPALEGEV
jgi:hypothetical protein